MFQKPKDHPGQNTVGDRGKKKKSPGREPDQIVKSNVSQECSMKFI